LALVDPKTLRNFLLPTFSTCITSYGRGQAIISTVILDQANDFFGLGKTACRMF